MTAPAEAKNPQQEWALVPRISESTFSPIIFTSPQEAKRALRRLKIKKPDARVALMSLPIPVHRLAENDGPSCNDRLPALQLDPVPELRFEDILEIMLPNAGEVYIFCYLHDDWAFADVEHAMELGSQWHNFEHLRIDSPRELMWRIALDLEAELWRKHPNLSARAVGSFWLSWQVTRYFHEVRSRLQSYIENHPQLQTATAPLLACDAAAVVDRKIRDYVARITNKLPLVSDSASDQNAQQIQGTDDGATKRSDWLNTMRDANGWTSDTEIADNHGPTYNAIQRYRSGKPSTRVAYVRSKLAKAFGCNLRDVPM